MLVALLAPEESFHHPAAADADLQPSVGEMIQHGNFLDQPQRMMQRQHVDAGAEAQSLRPLRGGGEEYVLRRRHRMHRRGVMLGEVIGEEAGLIERLELRQPFGIKPRERHAGQMLDMVENAEADAGHERSP